MSQYTAPTGGPTADYAGDPNDYQASGNGFDFNSIAGGVSSLLTPLLSFGASMYASSQGQPTPGTVIYQQGPNQQQQQQQSNMLLYAGAAIFLLILLGVAVMIFKRK